RIKRTSLTRRTDEIDKHRRSSPATVLHRRPAKRRQQRGRVEDIAALALGPFTLDEADHEHVREIAIAGCLGVDELYAAVARRGCEGLVFNPAADIRGELVNRHPTIVVVRRGRRERIEYSNDRRLCPSSAFTV